jgi:hypothetical protein
MLQVRQVGVLGVQYTAGVSLLIEALYEQKSRSTLFFFNHQKN